MLLAHGDPDVQEVMYTECHALIKTVLGVEYALCTYNLMDIAFVIFVSEVLSEIISHGLVHQNEKVNILHIEFYIIAKKNIFQIEAQ